MTSVTVPIWTSRISAQGLLAEAFSATPESKKRSLTHAPEPGGLGTDDMKALPLIAEYALLIATCNENSPRSFSVT